MKKVLVLGAGRSCSDLLQYFKKNASILEIEVTVADLNCDLAEKIIDKNNAFVIKRLEGSESQESLIKNTDLVISMLPARFHIDVAKICLKLGRNMVTASYVSDEMKQLNEAAKEKGLTFINECGLDPGIDHMSAMEMINSIRKEGGEITDFESFTGGLVAPESDDNPWNYKFTWNPRNVVLAGQGGAAKFLQEGTYKYIPYHKLFRRTEVINIDGYGKFEGYANRDSLSYIDIYGLDKIKTIFRGTLRKMGFCRAWDMLIQLGLTDDTYVIEDSENLTHREFLNMFLAYNPHDSVELKLKHYLKLHQDDVSVLEKLEYTGLYSNEKVGLKNATPAQILQHILEKKWSLKPDDKDMIIMYHKLKYKMGEDSFEKHAHMAVIGEDQIHTAMSKTVGIPVAIAAKLLLQGKIKTKGVVIPVIEELYKPILEEMKGYGIDFSEKTVSV